MKTQAILATLLLSSSVYAQQVTVSAAQPAAGRAQYDEATNTVVEPQAQVIDTRANPVIILNNQRLQEQPTTVVEASPLVESNAERMRKQRQGLEVNTEQRIVEKLEEARMEDERARAERLFGTGFGAVRATPTPVPAPVAPAPIAEPVPVVVVPQQQPVQAVAPAPAVVEVKEEKPEVDVKSEIRLAMEELNAKQETKPKQQYFVGGMVGLAEYSDAANVTGNVATGVTLGIITEDRIVVEGSLIFSDYQVNDYTQWYPWKDMEQYSFQAAVKYQVLPGKIRPFAGAVLGYTHRTVTNRDQLYSWGGGYAGPEGEGRSNAFDVGLTGGADLHLTNSFAIGAEARYMTNVSYKRDQTFADMEYWEQEQGLSAIEEMDHYSITVNGKFTF